MRYAIIAALALAGCSRQDVPSVGPIAPPSPYEVVAVGKNSYRIWVPTSEFPSPDGPPPQQPTVEIRVKKIASDYCAKSNMTMKQTGGDFDIGDGLNVIFSCVPAT